MSPENKSESIIADVDSPRSTEEEQMVVKVDDLQSNSDGAAGTDRAGTAERKTYGDTALNKGLEAQAKNQQSSKNND